MFFMILSGIISGIISGLLIPLDSNIVPAVVYGSPFYVDPWINWYEMITVFPFIVEKRRLNLI